MDEPRVGDRYRLLQAHAIGGMASVWRALDERTGQTVAVKRLHPYLVADAVARERLEREAAALTALHHPNIVEVRDLVLDADGPALVMGFVSGRTAAEALAADGPFPELKALAIAASVADALAAAHAAGIVHRDVTPSNVLLGDDGRVRLADFGIAAQEDALGALTQADGVIGTLRYLPPERLAGHVATPASDVWALGAVLVELVAGHPAIDAPDPAARLASPATMPERPAGMSDATWAVVRRAMDPDPLERYANGAAMAAELHAAAGTTPDRAIAGDVDPWGATRAVPLAAPSVPAAPVVSAAPSSPGPAFGAVLGGLALAAVIGLGVIGADRVARSGDGGGARAAPAALEATPAPTPRPTATPRPTEAPQPVADHGKHGEGDGNRKGKGKGHDD